MSQKKTRRVGVALVALAGLLLLSAGAALAQRPSVATRERADGRHRRPSLHRAAGRANPGRERRHPLQGVR
jgi:hypothetical protein